MFPRSVLNDLAAWKDRAGRMPLVIRGARQTGKSVAVRLFAERAFDSRVEVNFEFDPSLASLFASGDPAMIRNLLEVRFRTPIVPGRTLLFLDEIQAAPGVLATLRYFHEQMPELHVIAAGSLLDFALADARFPVPVGRIEYLHLGPLRFQEFLVACGEERLSGFLDGWRVGDAIPEAIHGRLMDLLRVYLVVGGMPRSVAAYAEHGNVLDSDRVLHSLGATFRDDFAKYGARVNVARVRKVFDAIPALVGTRFKYALVDREDRARELAGALDLLCLARVAHRVRLSAGNGVPLAAQADDTRFKVLSLDVGLMLASLGLDLVRLAGVGDPTVVNAGAVAEQFVGQHLLFSDEPYRTPDLFFWARDARGSAAEVDFLLADQGRVIPVEVKAGRTGTLKSLHRFVVEKGAGLALRFNGDLPSCLDTQASIPGEAGRPFRLLSLPLYLVGQARRLCREA